MLGPSWLIMAHGCRREVPKKTRTSVPEVKSNTQELDVKKCADHFESCGWDALEFDAR